MTTSNATILIVEDEAKMRRLLELNLASKPCPQAMQKPV
jgi:DNA-binding NtrC family response regulator